MRQAPPRPSRRMDGASCRGIQEWCRAGNGFQPDGKCRGMSVVVHHLSGANQASPNRYSHDAFVMQSN